MPPWLTVVIETSKFECFWKAEIPAGMIGKEGQKGILGGTVAGKRSGRLLQGGKPILYTAEHGQMIQSL